MTAKQAKRLATDEQLRKRLAELVVQQCFRNTALENLHAGTAPSSKTGDYSDVKVVSPYGEIPWPELSRFNDEEMKALMIDVVNKTYTLLSLLFASPPKMLEAVLNGIESPDMVSHWKRWHDPEITTL